MIRLRLARSRRCWPCLPKSSKSTTTNNPSPWTTRSQPRLMPRSSRRSQALELAIAPDQVVGGAVVPKFRLGRAIQLWNDPLRQHLAQIDAPLIEGVDVPNSALGECGVLIKRDEL